MLVRSGRRLTLKLPASYPHQSQFADSRHRMQQLALTA